MDFTVAVAATVKMRMVEKIMRDNIFLELVKHLFG